VSIIQESLLRGFYTLLFPSTIGTACDAFKEARSCSEDCSLALNCCSELSVRGAEWGVPEKKLPRACDAVLPPVTCPCGDGENFLEEETLGTGEIPESPCIRAVIGVAGAAEVGNEFPVGNGRGGGGGSGGGR